jgi:hypothetical protein
LACRYQIAYPCYCSSYTSCQLKELLQQQLLQHSDTDTQTQIGVQCIISAAMADDEMEFFQLQQQLPSPQFSREANLHQA